MRNASDGKKRAPPSVWSFMVRSLRGRLIVPLVLLAAGAFGG